MFTLLVFNDGRNDYLEQTLSTFFAQVSFPETPWIVNITLLRQPWYEDERYAGGMLKLHPEHFRDAVIRGVPVCLHQQYFGHNPGLYKREFARIIPDSSRVVPGRVLSHEFV